MRRGQPKLRYTCPSNRGAPEPGHIICGTSARTRRAYRVLGVRRGRNALPMMGFTTWVLTVEPMSIAAGREAIAEGAPAWSIKWDSRKPARRLDG